jgi:hypothetical protein
MKKLVLLFCFIFTSVLLYAQSIYFNNYYNPNNTGAVGINIYPINNGYVCSSLVCDSTLIKNNIMLVKLDSIGNQSYYKEFKLDSSDYYIGEWGGGGFAKCSNGGFILSGDIQRFNSIKNYLMRLNDNFDTLWTKIIYNDTIFSTITQCIESSDKGFVLCGQKQVNTTMCNVMIIKTDSVGSKLFEKNYNITGFNGSDIDKAWNVTETPDKGFLLGCYTYSLPSMGTYQGSGDPVVIKTDSMGNMLWIKNVGGLETDQGVGISVCKDNNYLIASVYSYYTEQYNDFWKGKLKVMKVSPTGSVIWDRQFEPLIENLSVIKIISLENGNIIIGGNKIHRISEFKSYIDNYLFKLSANGDSIWYKEYAKSMDTLNFTWTTLSNFEPTQDGGFVGCGEFLESNIVPQSIWVIKTDSMGCLQPGCQYVGIEELNKTITTLTVFPNPATTQTTITYPSLKMQGQLQVYNSLGQLIYTSILNKNSNQTILNTQAYKNGLYKIVLREKGEIKGQASLLIRN